MWRQADKNRTVTLTQLLPDCEQFLSWCALCAADEKTIIFKLLELKIEELFDLLHMQTPEKLGTSLKCSEKVCNVFIYFLILVYTCSVVTYMTTYFRLNLWSNKSYQVLLTSILRDLNSNRQLWARLFTLGINMHLKWHLYILYNVCRRNMKDHLRTILKYADETIQNKEMSHNFLDYHEVFSPDEHIKTWFSGFRKQAQDQDLPILKGQTVECVNTC